MRNSLRIRLTVIFIGLAVGPLIVVGAILAQRALAVERQQALDLQESVAQSVASEVGAYLQEIENDMRLRGGEIRSLEAADRGQSLSLLLGALSSGPYRDVYDEFALLDADGQELLRVTREDVVAEESLANRSATAEFVQAEASGETYYGPVTVNEMTGQSLMTIAVPLYEPRSVRLSGLLVANVRFDSVAHLIGDLDIGDGQNVYVVDAAGRLVAHPDSSVGLQPLDYELPDEAGMQAGLNGTSAVMGVSHIQLGEASEFVIVAERPLAEALRFATDTVRTLAIIVVAALVLAAGLGVVVVRQIVSPVEALAETAEYISGGDLTRRVNVTSRDEIGGLAKTFNAMTARLQETLESERLARREAQEASRLKDMFLATMSHELRTPLNAIVGFLGLMLFSEQLDEDNAHMAQRSVANADRLLSLINNILDLSRITSGRLEVTPVTMSPRKLAAALHEDLELQVAEKNLRFEVVTDESLPESIVHDEERIVQIATNLVNNAVKFTAEGEIELSFRRRGDRMVIEVSDTGMGIPAAKQQLIFDEFVQVDSSSTRKFGGAGLGLAIVKRLAVLMDGNVKVISEPGRGSTFTVDLPLELESVEITAEQEPVLAAIREGVL